MRWTLRLVALCICTAPAVSQSIGTLAGPMQYPEALAPWHFKTAFEMAFIKMPEAVVEEADTYRWPSWDVDVFMGLPANFVANGKVTTQFINWHFQVGAKWQYAITDELRTYLGADWAYFVGGVGAGGFDNSNRSTFFYPNLSVGYDFGPLALTLKGELNYLLSKQDRAGEIVVSNSKNVFNGFTTALYLEQPFWGETQFILAFRANYLKFVYQNWLLFPTTDTFYFVPEFILGVRL